MVWPFYFVVELEIYLFRKLFCLTELKFKKKVSMIKLASTWRFTHPTRWGMIRFTWSTGVLNQPILVINYISCLERYNLRFHADL